MSYKEQQWLRVLSESQLGSKKTKSCTTSFGSAAVPWFKRIVGDAGRFGRKLPSVRAGNARGPPCGR